jgi:hypothetical protein
MRALRIVLAFSLIGSLDVLAADMKHGEVLPDAEMKAKYHLTAEARPIVHLKAERVPAALRHLVPLAEKWGIADDIIRQDFESKSSQRAKATLRSSLKGFNGRVTAWLDSVPKGREMPPEAVAFMYMQVSLEEMGLWVD